MLRSTKATLLILLLMGLAGCFEATYPKNILGTVRNRSNATLSSVSVEARVQGKSAIYQTTTNGSGTYSVTIPGVKNGDVINVKHSLAGYSSLTESFISNDKADEVLIVYLDEVISGEKIGGYASLMNIIPPTSSTSSLIKRSVKVDNREMPREATEIIIKPKMGAEIETIKASLVKRGSVILRQYFELNIILVSIPEGVRQEQFIDEITKERWVEYAEPNNIAYTSSITLPNDPYLLDKQWDMFAVSMPYVWSTPDFSSIITIAVLDTRVDVNHPEIIGNADALIDLINAPYNTSHERYPHGTHVAGIIAAAVNNLQYMAGMNNGAIRILPIRVMDDSGSGTTATIAAGIVEAVDRGADIINLSLRSGEGTTLTNAINAAVAQDVLVVAAAGNNASSTVDYPARLPNVIAVSSINSTFTLSDFSNHGDEIDFAAPGGSFTQGVWSLYPRDATPNSYFYQMAGTSQATPHVSALIGMLKQAGYSNTEIIDIIAATSQFDDRNQLSYGKGIINAHAAMNRLTMDRAVFWLTHLDGTAIGGYYGRYGNIDRSFELDLPPSPGSYYLNGWVDTDGDGVIFVGPDWEPVLDEGDYFGQEQIDVNSLGIFLDHVFELRHGTTISGSSFPSKVNSIPHLPEGVR